MIPCRSVKTAPTEPIISRKQRPTADLFCHTGTHELLQRFHAWQMAGARITACQPFLQQASKARTSRRCKARAKSLPGQHHGKRQPEIAQQNLPMGVGKQVVGIQVTMHDASVMQVR